MTILRAVAAFDDACWCFAAGLVPGLRLRGTSARLSGDAELVTVATYYGPAYQITNMTGSMAGQAIHSILLNCHVPIDQHSFTLRYGVLVKKIPGLGEAKRGNRAGAWGWVEKYGLIEAIEALERGRLTEADTHGLIKDAALKAWNEAGMKPND